MLTKDPSAQIARDTIQGNVTETQMSFIIVEKRDTTRGNVPNSDKEIRVKDE